MATYRSKTVLASALLVGALAFAGCGAANDATDSASKAADSASSALDQGLTDEQKGKLEPAIKDYFKTISTAELPSEMPEDIQAILEKVDPDDDVKSTKNMADALSKLSEEDQQKLESYLKDADPSYDLFDRSGISTAESIVLSIMNMSLGSSLASSDLASVDTFTVDTSKVEFNDKTAVTKADSFVLNASSSASPSDDTQSDSVDEDSPALLFDGTTFTFEGDTWKIDAASFLGSLDKLVEKANQ